jgi:hypothetical protein
MTDAELFLKYNYPETKDMCLHFLTQVTAVLAFSIRFAEKVANFPNVSRGGRQLVIVGRCSYLLSITFCGLDLATNSLAGGDAVYREEHFQTWGEWAYLFIIVASVFFVLGLILSIISAVTAKSGGKKVDG